MAAPAAPDLPDFFKLSRRQGRMRRTEISFSSAVSTVPAGLSSGAGVAAGGSALGVAVEAAGVAEVETTAVSGACPAPEKGGYKNKDDCRRQNNSLLISFHILTSTAAAQPLNNCKASVPPAPELPSPADEFAARRWAKGLEHSKRPKLPWPNRWPSYNR